MVTNGKNVLPLQTTAENCSFCHSSSSVPAHEAIKIRPGFFNFMRNFIGIDSAPIFYTDFKFRSVCIQDVGYLIGFRYEDKNIFWRMVACRIRSRRLSQSMNLASIGMFSRLSTDPHVFIEIDFQYCLGNTEQKSLIMILLSMGFSSTLVADSTIHKQPTCFPQNSKKSLDVKLLDQNE